MIIYIIGPGGVGKTTTGRILSKKLNFKFIDLDDEFCKRIQNIGSYIHEIGYEKYCLQNSELFYQILNEAKDNLVFTLSSGFLVHENQDDLTNKHKKTLKETGISILLLPSRSKKLSADIVVKRQMTRGFGLIESRERKKFLDRFPKYRKFGNIKIFSRKSPESIAEIMEQRLSLIIPSQITDKI